MITASKLSIAASIAQRTWRHPANDGRRLAALLSTVHFEIGARLFGWRRIAHLGNMKIWADIQHYSSALVIQGSPPDWNEMLAWRDILTPDGIFVDVGANIGVYTLWAIQTGAQVVALEPNDEARARLIEHLKLNNVKSRATVLDMAAGEEVGSARISTNRDANNHLVAAGGQVIDVITLDELLLQRDTAIRGVKIDVEGMELPVLKGARQLLARHRIDVLQIEWNDQSRKRRGESRASEAQLLQSYGYRIMRPNETGRLVPAHGKTSGADIFAVSPRAELTNL